MNAFFLSPQTSQIQNCKKHTFAHIFSETHGGVIIFWDIVSPMGIIGIA